MKLPPLLKFTSFQSAIDYHSKCPTCHGNMKISNEIGDITHLVSLNKIVFYLNEDILILDTQSEDITINIKQRTAYQPIYTIGCMLPVSWTPSYLVKSIIPSSGFFTHKLNINCISCCQFSYTIQMVIDVSQLKLVGFYLNSESINVENDGIVYNIRNAYSIYKTEYMAYSVGKANGVSLPLIQLDLVNLIETVERIKKLILFS